jgi:uncharacterized membrane protein YfcA
MPSLEVASIFAVVTLAACVQGSIGFGMALIAAPILVLMDPTLVPGPLMLSSLVLVTLVAVRDRAHADLKTVRWAIVGNLFGSAVGASVLASLSPRAFAVSFGLLVLLGVGLSTAGFRVRVTRSTALGAGWLGGFMATTSAIGGPPLAMLYQHEQAERFRGTLAAYFIMSCTIGLIALALVGRFGAPELEQAMLLIPGQITGFALSFATAKVLKRTGVSIRPFILGLSAVAAVAVIARVLI